MRSLAKLSGPQVRAGVTAVALLLCMILPWYRSGYTVPNADRRIHENLSAFSAFSFVEAAVLLVSGAILYLLWTRAQGRAFHLPGGDGMAVTAGGAWCVFLLIWRLFDRPEVEQGNVGLQWGIFVTLAVAAGLVAAGQRMRAERRPEPPNPAEDPTWEQPTRRQRRPVDTAAVTRVLGEERPDWEGEPPPPPRRAEPARPKPKPPDGRLF